MVVPTEASEYYLRMIRVKSPVFVVPTGIETEKFHQPCSEEEKARLRRELGIEEGDKVLLSVSRLNAEKNIEFMLEAVAELVKKGVKNFKFILIGDGPDRSSLVRAAHALGLRDVLVFTGSVSPDAIPTYYSLGDVFVFASTSETQGMVILEAMASGMPVVAIRASGIDDFVVDGVTGFKTIHHVEGLGRKGSSFAGRECFTRGFVPSSHIHGGEIWGGCLWPKNGEGLCSRADPAAESAFSIQS